MDILDCAPPYKLVRARHGLFLVSPGDAYIGRALMTYGEFSEIEWESLSQLMRPGFDAIEVGANIGAHTVSMARKLAGDHRRLLAVEAQPVIFQNLCANVALNGLFNVNTENCACSDESGWLSFNPPDYAGTNNFGGIAMREDGLGSERVRACRLDELVPESWRIGLIKIDVEGFEQKVLEGARQIIARHRPILYVENDRKEKSRSLIEWLWSENYQLWWDTPGLFNPDNFAGIKENLYPNIVSLNMLCFPAEMPGTVNGLHQVTDATFHPLSPR